MSVETLLSRLQGVKSTGKDSWMAKCCAHEDRSPSLAIKSCPDGRILIKCFAGCSADEVVSAIGMELKDLMPETPLYHRKNPDRVPFNPYDVLAAVRDDMTVALVIAKDMQKGVVPTEVQSMLLAKLTGRITMAIQLAGGRE